MSAEAAAWLFAVEFALPFMVLSVVLIVMIKKGQTSYKEAARSLILKIKNNEEKHRREIAEFLNSEFAIDDSEISKMTTKIINERKFLFRNLISGLLDKNTEALELLEDDLTRITNLYHQLEVAQKPFEEVAQAPELSDEDNPDKQKIVSLKQDVKGLKHEIHVTLTTLNNIFGEFSSMFGEEVPQAEMSVDQIITAMETFSNKSASRTPAADSTAAETETAEPDAFAEPDDVDIAEAAVRAAVAESAAMPTEVKPMSDPEPSQSKVNGAEEETLNFSIDSELDDIDSALDELELGATSDDEPSWDEAFEESGDTKSDEK